MLRLVSRLLGYLLLLAAVSVLALDLWQWWQGEAPLPSLRPLGRLWFSLDPGSLSLVQAVIERYLLGWLWDPIILTLLTWGAAPLFAIAALFFLWLGSRR